MSLTLTIVRHGDTFAPGEPPRRIGAATDLPLVASGEVQARALGRAFAHEMFDRVLVSPLKRTRRTAELLLGEESLRIQDATVMARRSLAQENGLSDGRIPIEIAPWLAEIDHGPDENATEDAVIARIGAAALARWNDGLVVPPGWTVDADARLAAWRTLLAGARGHVLLVTSAGAARFALAADAGLARQAASLPTRKLRTGAWGRIVVADGKPQIVAWDERPGAVDG